MKIGVAFRGLGHRLLAYTPLLGVLVFCALNTAQPVAAAAGINQQINFQGRLLNSQGATVPDGFYNIQFKIYQDGDGLTAGDTTGSPTGTLLWTENHLNNASNGVQVKNGFMSVQLGAITAFGGSIDWNQDTIWLSMNIGDTNLTCTPFSSCTPDGEMVPMKRMSATPYALNAGQLGGLTSAGFVQLAPGAAQTDATTNNSIFINKTGSGDAFNLQSSGTTAFRLTNAGDEVFGANANHSITVTTAGAGVAGKSLTVTGGNAGTGGGLTGGNLILQGGSGSAASGSVIVRSNTANSTSAFQVQDASQNSLFNVDSSGDNVNLGHGFTLPVPTFGTPTLTTTGGSITNGTTYYYAITASDGTNTTEISPVISYTVVSGTSTNKINLSWSQSIGATSYKIYRNTTNNFTSGSLLLTTIGSGATTTYSDTGSSTSSGLPPVTAYSPTLLRVDAAATNPFGDGQVAKLGSMYYNTTSGEFQCYKDSNVGGTWADCGVTTLQGAYSNATNSATQPAIKLDATHGTLNLQDADTTIAADILDLRASNGVGLGAVMFGVGNTGAVTMQNTTDQSGAMRVLNSGGNYVVNVNTASGYLIANTTKQLSNGVQNPSFEAGGNLTSGEEGWNGPAQGSIVNSSSNAHTGNYELQVTPNSTSLKVYAGTYYEVQSGDVVYFESWVKNAGGSNGTGGIIIEGYDKDKSLIGSATDSGSLPGTTYVIRGTSYTVPSNVAYVRVAAVVNSGATTGTYYFDDAMLTSSRRGQTVYQNSLDSTTAFRILSAGGSQTMFTADTTDNYIKIGDSTGTDTATTMFVLDSTGTTPTTLTGRNGGLFFNSATNNLEAVISGTVVDVCTTAVTCSGYSASAGSTVQLQASSPGTTQTGNFNITGTGILTQLQTQDQSASSTNSSGLTIRTGNATGSASNSGNLVIDVGTATGTTGSITVGHGSVVTTMPGSLVIQGANALELGTSSSSEGKIKLHNSSGSNTVTLAPSTSNPTSSWTFSLPQNPTGTSGYCLKASGTSGGHTYGDCGVGATVTLQDVYSNSSSPATTTLDSGKDIKIVSQEAATDGNILFNLQCTTCSTTGGFGDGRFEVQNGGTAVFTVKPNSGGVVLAIDTQIGSATTDGTQTNFHLDSYNGSTDTGTCSTTTNQGALYYNSTMGSLRGCINGSWGDVSNPDTLGLLTFGIIPSSGATPYDLPSLVTAGVSGPCKVSWKDATHVNIEACVAYSGGRRVNVTANSNFALSSASLTTTNIWTHLCLDSTGALTLTAASSSPTANLATIYPSSTFSVSAPQLCLASIKGSTTTGGNIDDLYDVRTFTSTIKEAVNTTTASDLGMLVDAASGGLIPAVCGGSTCSGKLYGVIVAGNGSTSTTSPNAIVASVGPAFVKAIAGTAGQFIQTSSTNGYGTTVTGIPNNAFYFSPGNTRTTWSTTCTAANNCAGSLYVNFIVR